MISLTWLSKYSWFKIQSQETIIHIDPGYAGYFENQGISDCELEKKADLILVTHFHKDHCQPVALSKIRDARTIAIAPERCVERIGGRVEIIKPGDVIARNDITIAAVDAYNTPTGNSTRKSHHKGDGVGYILTVDKKKIYHAGDTDFIPEMKKLGSVDIALLPIGGTFTMDIQEALKAAMVIKPEIVVPMHISKAAPQEFKDRVKAKSRIKVIPLKICEAFQI